MFYKTSHYPIYTTKTTSIFLYIKIKKKKKKKKTIPCSKKRNLHQVPKKIKNKNKKKSHCTRKAHLMKLVCFILSKSRVRLP